MATWTALGAGSRSMRSIQATTEAAPTTTAEGVLLTSVSAIATVVRANSGTFDGTGFLRAYAWHDLEGHWARMPRLDDDFNDATGLSEVALPTIPFAASSGRYAVVTEGVGISGGSQLTIDFVAYNYATREAV